MRATLDDTIRYGDHVSGNNEFSPLFFILFCSHNIHIQVAWNNQNSDAISQLIIAGHFWYPGVVVVGIEREREIGPFTQFWVSNWGGIEIERIGKQGNLHVNSAYLTTHRFTFKKFCVTNFPF
jgi:hypothetical protein